MSSKPPEPRVYTPFFRRFTDERARDVAETHALYTSVRARYLASDYSGDDSIKNFVLSTVKHIDTPLTIPFCVAMDGVYRMEDSIFGFPDTNLKYLSLKEQVDLNRMLRAKDYFFAHEDQCIETFVQTVLDIFSHIASLLPKTFSPSPFVIPLAFSVPDPKTLIGEIFNAVWTDDLKNKGLFVNLSRQLYFNLCEASGIPEPFEPKKASSTPTRILRLCQTLCVTISGAPHSRSFSKFLSLFNLPTKSASPICMFWAEVAQVRPNCSRI